MGGARACPHSVAAVADPARALPRRDDPARHPSTRSARASRTGAAYRRRWPRLSGGQVPRGEYRQGPGTGDPADADHGRPRATPRRCAVIRVIYRWTVDPAAEDQFIDAWRDATERIRAHQPGAL